MSTNLPAISKIKNLLSNNELKARFSEMLGENAASFMNSIINVTYNSNQLQKCEPASIMNAALTAATLDLPVDPNLGFAAIVPYGNAAQFQIMWKGLVQLAIRTGQYQEINVSEVYEDELLSYNPITGIVSFVNDFSQTTQRKNGEQEKIIGYYAYFKLMSGYSKQLYMSKDDCYNHAKQYSQSFRYDLSSNKKNSKWTTDFNAMAKKTLVKMLLSKWGIMSAKMRKAYEEDQKVYDDKDGNYLDNTAIEIPVEKGLDVLNTPLSSDFNSLAEAVKLCKNVTEIDGILFDMESSDLSESEIKKLKERIELRKMELKG